MYKWIIGLFLLCTSTLTATEVNLPSESGFNMAKANHQVYDELLFENEMIRVWRTYFFAGSQVGMNRYDFPRLVVGVENGVVRMVQSDGTTRNITLTPGSILWLEPDPAGSQHADYNDSNKDFSAIVVEFKTTRMNK